MSTQTLYFLFTDTGTYLSKAINCWTRQQLNHVSISFDPSLTEVYSFGRKRPRNPFIGGFVREDVTKGVLKDSECAIYQYTITEADYKQIVDSIETIEARQELYKYNLIGLFGVMLQIRIERQRAMFCSQFVATMLQNVSSVQINKDPCLITPADIRMMTGMELVYNGKLDHYHTKGTTNSLNTMVKRSG